MFLFLIICPTIKKGKALTGSDWEIVLDAFIKDSRFKPMLDSLIEKRLGKAFGEVASSISNINADLQDLQLRQSELEHIAVRFFFGLQNLSLLPCPFLR